MALYDDPPHPARHEAGDEAQAAYAVIVILAAVARREREAGAVVIPA